MSTPLPIPLRFSTKAIHSGQKPEPHTGAIIPPIYQTSTFVQESPGVYKGYDYTRAGNPNFTNLEEAIAALEGGAHATVFSSGLGATTALLFTLKAGDTVLAGHDLYGGTYRLLTACFAQFGLRLVQVDMADLGRTEAMILHEKPAMIFLESPTNPLMQIADITALSALATRAGALSVVDNTFASPYFQQPLALGSDVVLHSSTKYLGGHSDVIGGAVITNDGALKKKMDFARKALGLNPSPFDAWLTQRGIKTLAVRMQRHEENAMALARWLEGHPLVSRVYYPGLPSHLGHAIATKQMSGFSGMLSVEFRLGLQQMKELISSFDVFLLAESLGGVESLVEHPATMTHASIPAEERRKNGLTDGLVRFSVGIEDIEDLRADVERGLQKFSS